MSKTPFLRRKLPTAFLAIGLTVGALFLARGPLSVATTKWCLKRALPPTLSFEKIEEREGTIYVKNLEFFDKTSQLHFERVSLTPNYKKVLSSIGFWRKSIFTPHSQAPTQRLRTLLLLELHGLSFEVVKAHLKLNHAVIPFSYHSGTLSIFEKEEAMTAPFLSAHFQWQEQQLISRLKIEPVSLKRVFPLATFFWQNLLNNWEGAEGNLEGEVISILDENGGVEQLSTHLLFEHFHAWEKGKRVELSGEKFEVDLKYPEGIENAGLPFWKQVLCFSSIENGKITIEEGISLSSLHGSVSLDSREDPRLEFKGELSSRKAPLHLSLIGRGSTAEHNAYCLNFGLHLEDQHGVDCDSYLSLYTTDGGAFVLEMEGDRLRAEQLEMGRKSFLSIAKELEGWEILEGVFSGKGVVFLEQGKPAQLEVRDFFAEDVLIGSREQNKTCYFPRIQAEGKLVPDGESRQGELSIELTFPVSHGVATVAPALLDSFRGYRSADLLRLTATTQFASKGTETTASIEWIDLKQSIQFGFQSGKIFPQSLEEIQRGWARSERLSHLFYGPFLSHFSKDLEIYGEVDLLASFQNGGLEALFQVDNFVLNHPLIDLQAKRVGEKETTQGRGKLAYDTQSDRWRFDLPMFNGRCYHRETGLVLENLDALFSIDSSHHILQAGVRGGDLFFDGKPLLENTHFSLTLNQESLFLSEGKGEIAQREGFTLHIPQFILGKEDSRCTFSIQEKGKELLAFAGEKQETWQGTLSHPFPIASNLLIDFSLDPIKQSFQIKAGDTEGNNLVELRREDGALHFDRLVLGEATYHGRLSSSQLLEFSISHPQFTVQLSGPLSCNFLSTQDVFKLSSELKGAVSVKDPLPTELKMDTPCKLTFSPKEGWALRSIHLEGDGSHFELGSLVSNFQKGEVTLEDGQFLVGMPLMKKAIQHRLFPKWVEDLRLPKELGGKVSLKRDQNGLVFHGTLGDDLPLQGKITSEKKLSFTLGDLQGEMSGGNVHALHGHFGPLSVDLSPTREEKLKGTLSCDLFQLATIFSHPISDQLQKMGLGIGLSLSGDFDLRSNLNNWIFQGKLVGDQFTWMGHTFRSLEAKMGVEPGKISLERIDLTDEVGKLWIGEGEIVQRGEENPFWTYSFPVVELRSFQPNLLNPSQQKSSLLIKSATIQNVRGRMDTLASLSASGTCRFARKMKKGEDHPFQNLPIQALNRLQIEPGHLVPVSGEIDFVVQSGRCYLQNLRGVRGDKNQLDFNIPKAKGSGYLDFGGNLFLNIEVKKRGGRRETLPLSIRGTWNEPVLSVDSP